MTHFLIQTSNDDWQQKDPIFYLRFFFLAQKVFFPSFFERSSVSVPSQSSTGSVRCSHARFALFSVFYQPPLLLEREREREREWCVRVCVWACASERKRARVSGRAFEEWKIDKECWMNGCGLEHCLAGKWEWEWESRSLRKREGNRRSEEGRGKEREREGKRGRESERGRLREKDEGSFLMSDVVRHLGVEKEKKSLYTDYANQWQPMLSLMNNHPAPAI